MENNNDHKKKSTTIDVVIGIIFVIAMFASIAWELEVVAVTTCVAYITYLLELPVIYEKFRKAIGYTYIRRITFFINIFTNLLMNGVLYPLLREFINHGTSPLLPVELIDSGVTLLACEGIVVLLEILLYSLALVNYEHLELDEGKVKNAIIPTVIWANVKSFIIGMIIIQFLVEFGYQLNII